MASFQERLIRDVGRDYVYQPLWGKLIDIALILSLVVAMSPWISAVILGDVAMRAIVSRLYFAVKGRFRYESDDDDNDGMWRLA